MRGAITDENGRLMRRIPPKQIRKTLAVLSLLIIFAGCSTTGKKPNPIGQFPSPMVEHTRAHERVERTTFPGTVASVDGILEKPFEVYVPEAVQPVDSFDIVIHLHGAGYLVGQAVANRDRPTIAIAVNLGAGSSAYERPFTPENVFADVTQQAIEAAQRTYGANASPSQIIVTAFSAGYGGVRALLRQRSSVEKIDGLILMDGLHASYEPEGVPLAEGSAINTEHMRPFVEFARKAVAGQKALLITHSEIFPGTYVSTTEAADYLLAQWDLERRPVSEWGPIGMQQLSESGAGRFIIKGFAGNTAPDHVDHLHAMDHWLQAITSLPN